jgi:hypothetical protein
MLLSQPGRREREAENVNTSLADSKEKAKGGENLPSSTTMANHSLPRITLQYRYKLR